MNDKIIFKFESLLYGVDIFKGAIEQVLFAKKVAEYEGLRSFNRLARVTFGDPAINREMQGAVPLDETLLIGYEGWNDTVLHLCIRSGKSACRIATAYSQNRKVIIHREYRDAFIVRKLTDTELSELFSHAWDNPQTIQPIPKHLDE